MTILMAVVTRTSAYSALDQFKSVHKDDKHNLNLPLNAHRSI